jgi:hypothetical protein
MNRFQSARYCNARAICRGKGDRLTVFQTISPPAHDASRQHSYTSAHERLERLADPVD